MPQARLSNQQSIWTMAPLPIAVDDSSIHKLDKYLDMLAAWNKVINLAGFNNKQKIALELIWDSFYLAYFLEKLFSAKKCANPQIIDLGAGAGLPGIPLRICWQKGYYSMIESRQKRALFLNNVIANLELPATTVHCSRVENFFDKMENINRPDCIISRAFKPWPEVLQLCAPNIKSDGIIIIMANVEAPDITSAWTLLEQYKYKILENYRWFWAIGPNQTYNNSQ